MLSKSQSLVQPEGSKKIHSLYRVLNPRPSDFKHSVLTTTLQRNGKLEALPCLIERGKEGREKHKEEGRRKLMEWNKGNKEMKKDKRHTRNINNNSIYPRFFYHEAGDHDLPLSSAWSSGLTRPMALFRKPNVRAGGRGEGRRGRREGIR
jgi:hypothetical protein